MNKTKRIIEQLLFPKAEWESMKVNKVQECRKVDSNQSTTSLHYELCPNASFTGIYEMPVVQPIQCEVPRNIIAVYRYPRFVPLDCAGHFYTSDNRFEYVWTNPYKGLESIRHFSLIISPDFSVYSNFLLPQKTWNIFRNKLLASWWQRNGCKVIPNVSWLYGCDYAISFDGWPKESVIAVNSTGINRNLRCQKMWLHGYYKMLEALRPTHILRYGGKVPGECENISTYYENNNKTFSHNGRK
jgi:hypothetical protein